MGKLVMMLWVCSVVLWGGVSPHVTVGMYVIEVDEIDLKANTFTSDFYLWFRWRDDRLKPYQSFGIIHGDILSNTLSDLKDLPNGEHYACVKVKAMVRQHWNITRFPLDDHVLRIGIEDETYSVHDLLYVADERNTKLSSARFVNGYYLNHLHIRPHVVYYDTNYGDLSLPSSAGYSRIDFEIVAHGGTYVDFFKTYWGLLISLLVALIAFVVRPENLDQRLNLSIGAIFAASASSIVIFDGLPQSKEFVLAEKINILTLILILFIALISSILYRCLGNRCGAWAHTIDRWLLVMIPIVYLIGIAMFIVM